VVHDTGLGLRVASSAEKELVHWIIPHSKVGCAMHTARFHSETVNQKPRYSNRAVTPNNTVKHELTNLSCFKVSPWGMPSDHFRNST